MRLIVPILFALLLAQSPPQQVASPAQPGKCGVDGTVISAVSGEPLGKATVLLEGIAPDNARIRFTADTNATGAFSLRNIDPGKYRMHAQGAGFVDQAYGAPLALQPGMVMKDVVFKLMPQGVVTGRITNPDGEPLAHVSVSLSRIAWNNHGQKELTNFDPVSTNDLGQYRIFNIPPGRYYLNAALPAYAPTWYSGTVDPRNAALLDIQAGATTSGVDLQLLKTVEQRIDGTVDTSNAGPADVPILIHLAPRDAVLPAVANTPSAIRNSAPAFEIHAPPGSYYVVARKTAGATTYAGLAPVEVTTHDVTGITIALQPAVKISGKLHIAGVDDLKAFANSNVQVRAESKELTGVVSGPVAGDGTFGFTTTGFETLDIGVTGMPAGYYVKSITYAQQDVRETGLTYVPTSDLLDIVVSPNAATVSGVVHDKGGDPIAGATVVLAPPPGKRNPPGNFRTTVTDQTGYFAIGSLAPGDYTLFAWDDVQPNEYYAPDFLKSAESGGQHLTLEEGSQEVVNYQIVAGGTPAAPPVK